MSLGIKVTWSEKEMDELCATMTRYFHPYWTDMHKVLHNMKSSSLEESHRSGTRST